MGARDSTSAGIRAISRREPEPVEDVGEVVAGPAFGDLLADDMIDMNSFGVNLEPCRRDVVIGSKVRRAQAPARHHLCPGQTCLRRSRANREMRPATPE